MKRILVATDFSRRADFAAAWAVRRAADARCPVVLYHAVTLEGPGHPLVEVHRKSVTEWLERQSKQAEQVTCAALRALAPTVELTCDVEVVDERVAGIVAAAKRHDTEAIVVGSRGENALSRAVLGSVAAGVLTQAACNVVVVPRHARYHGLNQVVLVSDLVDLDRDLAGLGRFAGEPRPALRIVHLRYADDPPPAVDAVARAAASGWIGATFADVVGDEWPDAIDEIVADVGADLVAMTVQPHGLVYRLFHRDLVHAVAFQGLVPLLGIRG